MKKIWINILLFFVAVFLLLTVGIFGLVFAILWTLFNFKRYSFIKFWGDLLYSINMGIDMIGNVMLGVFLNEFFIHDQYIYPFGSVKHTISHVLAVNLIHHQNVTKFGMVLVDILEFLDPDHMKKSLNL
jgi:hypothetical protein